MLAPRGFELTYCSNIHPAHGWPQVFESLQRISTELKRRLSPAERFGIGLRISNNEAIELLEAEKLAEFRRFLDGSGLYVALINGFPFAGFHDCRLKDQVFAPDWHAQERVDYTLRLAAILSELAPEDLDAGISTCPLSYKRWERDPDWGTLLSNVIRVAEALHRINLDNGRVIHLDIEPEPDGLVENTREFIEFYKMLLRRAGEVLGSRGEEIVRQHVALCYDVCHFAVEHEDPGETLTELSAAGVPIGRAQISSAIKAAVPAEKTGRDALRDQLAPLADSTYLHQIIGASERFADLPDGLARLNQAAGSEWRIHYHVPLFLSDYGMLHSTQESVRGALAQLSTDLVRHLEIETYTWGVLPPELKLDLTDSIEREYRWVLGELS